MQNRPSIRHGLPYAWWRTRGFRDAMRALGALVAILLVFVVLPVGILGAWFGLWGR